MTHKDMMMEEAIASAELAEGGLHTVRASSVKKDRNTLIEEIVQSFDEKYGAFELCDVVTYGDRERLIDFLRPALIKVSDVSMDSVEVEESVGEKKLGDILAFLGGEQKTLFSLIEDEQNRGYNESIQNTLATAKTIIGVNK